MIEIKKVSKRFGKKEVLRDISCVIEKGVYGLLGPNGAGKTTLMRCMTDLYPLSSGDILIDGVSIKKKDKSDIGYLPQSFALFKELSVYDSMNYFCNLKGIGKKNRKEEIMRCIHAVNMEKYLKRTGGKLSGGMMRRIGVAQALLSKPELVLFDEPTAGLDPEERIRFKNIISSLGEQETVIISTHIVEDVDACCEKVIIMDRGEILSIKTCRELVEDVQGKVIACRKGEEEKLTSDYFIEKQYEKDGDIYYRVIVNDRNEADMFEALEPTIEDGYMAIIKKL
ncbi:MAG: ATP-binding cassette domain-containing protein [Roseburia sp.]|nr:ATP-binding cassette domain-containing protein [Roseburia sp.]